MYKTKIFKGAGGRYIISYKKSTIISIYCERMLNLNLRFLFLYIFKFVQNLIVSIEKKKNGKIEKNKNQNTNRIYRLIDDRHLQR